ncbi:MAG: hypothetical protein D6730_09010 [Bacteroidetes bacterium]|nr:MAG: hypothetical protein D6730_09010 [Bacteroidota bacterium]
MNMKIFVIGIGGTGMRCLESFVHLCAMGMFDNTEIDMLALDTDRENGNFCRLKELVDVYNKAKGVNKEHYPLQDTLFSAKINYYQFSPDYSRQDTGNFARLTKYGDLRHSNAREADLANLLFTQNTREFDLKHGYRAQTNLGSFLMYHNIIEEVQTNHAGDLARFISSLITASQTGSPRVFVMGSVFGGTGASSIPVIPKAFNKAANILAPGSSLKNAFFGSILLTSYFSFKVPSSDYVARQLVVATSEKFAMNSQAAMMFYNEDRTVKQTYQKFYMLGTPTIEFRTEHDENETITGGSKQENDAHYIELFAAFAAYDFFHTDEDALRNIREEGEVQYYFRSVSADGTLEFSDFVKAEDVPKFAKRLGMATVMSHLVNLKADFYAAAKSGALAKNDNITGYEDIDEREVKAIKRYFELFNFRLDEGEVRDGWLRQIYKSVGGGDKFLLNAAMFSPTTERELNKLNYSNKLYKEDFEHHKFSTGLFGTPFDSFKKTFKERANDPKLTNKCEMLTKRMYDALCTLYNFKEEA